MKKPVFLLLYIIGISLSLFGMDFNALMDMAIKNDPQLKQLKLSLDNAILEKKRSELQPGISVTIGNNTSPSLSISHSFTNNNSTVSITPYVSLNLGDPYYTNFSVASRLTSTFTPEGPKIQIAPSLSVSQPLNSILGLTESTELTEKQNLYYIEKAKIAIQNRITEIKEEFLSQIKLILQTEQELEKNEYLLGTEENQLTKTEKLGNYSKDSYEYLALDNEIKNLKRTIEYLKTKLEMLKQELEHIVGMKIDKLPEPPTENKIPPDFMRPIEKIDLEHNPDYILANIEREIALLKLKNQTEGTLPEYTVGLGYSSGTNSTTPQNQTDSNLIRESFSFKLEDISLQATISQKLSTGDINGEVTFSWTHNFDNTEEKIDTEELTNNLEIAKLKLLDTIKKVKQSVADINISLGQLINERLAIKSNTIITQKQLKQIKERFNKGLATSDQVNEVVWNLKELKFEDKLNIISIYLLAVKREGLFIQR